jgi:hypothetical protein
VLTPAAVNDEILLMSRHSLARFEIALVLVRFDHIASFNVNSNHSIM